MSTEAGDRTALLRSRRLAFPALLLGGAALGLSPIFVRLADAGPSAMPFGAWRWPCRSCRCRWSRAVLLAGAFFAADLAVWHWSIFYTRIANATLLATLGAWALFASRVSGAKDWMLGGDRSRLVSPV